MGASVAPTEETSTAIGAFAGLQMGLIAQDEIVHKWDLHDGQTTSALDAAAQLRRAGGPRTDYWGMSKPSGKPPSM